MKRIIDTGSAYDYRCLFSQEMSHSWACSLEDLVSLTFFHIFKEALNLMPVEVS